MKAIMISALLALLTVNASAYEYEIKGIKVDLSDKASDKGLSYASQAYYALSGNKPMTKEKPQHINNNNPFDSFTSKTIEEYNAKREIERKAEREYKLQLAKKPAAAIGMSKSQVRNKTNWGEPKYINTTTNKYGTHEQWVYDDYQYLYFDNGKLTTIQQ